MQECCNAQEMMSYVINCGYEYTSDIFFIEGNVYCRLLQTHQYTQQFPGNVVVHKTVTTNVYFCWSYVTNIRRYLDVKDFYIQFKYFKLIKQNHPDYFDKLLDTIAEHDLSSLAFTSEHLF